MGRAIGIDFGTSFSCMAILHGMEAEVIPNVEGDRLTPSVVAIGKDGQLLVGEPARRQSIINPDNTIFSIKRLLSRRFGELDNRLLPFKITKAANGNAMVVMGSRHYQPPEISAMILRKLHSDAEAHLGEIVSGAVITVPAYFNDIQRRAIEEACKIAGFEVYRIINEPTAAALAYGLDIKRDVTIAVYHLGGGTFDISILEIGGGTFAVKSTNGDTHLGGDDFDHRIVDWLCDEFNREHGIDLSKDKTALQRLREAAERAKCELSTIHQTEIELPFIATDTSGSINLNISLSRTKLEQLVMDLMDKTIGTCKQALADADKTATLIDEVVLVGGQTRMPLVEDKVEQFFGKKPRRGVHPDEAVAIGAAIQAGIIRGELNDCLLLDVIPLTLGIETQGGEFVPLIPCNTTIPTSSRKEFTTTSDNQTSVEIHVLQGESSRIAGNVSLGRYILHGILPAPKGVPQIEVTFDIDANGILNVQARDKKTGWQQRITVVPTTV